MLFLHFIIFMLFAFWVNYMFYHITFSYLHHQINFIRSFVLQCGMYSLCIVEIHIVLNSEPQLRQTDIIFDFDVFAFQRPPETLHFGIITTASAPVCGLDFLWGACLKNSSQVIYPRQINHAVPAIKSNSASSLCILICSSVGIFTSYDQTV